MARAALLTPPVAISGSLLSPPIGLQLASVPVDDGWGTDDIPSNAAQFLRTIYCTPQCFEILFSKNMTTPFWASD